MCSEPIECNLFLMKVTHLQNVRQIFHEKTYNLCNEFVASYFFFLKGFLEYDILKKKKQFLYDGVWTVVTYLPRLGPHSLRSRGTSS